MWIRDVHVNVTQWNWIDLKWIEQKLMQLILIKHNCTEKMK